MRWFICFAITLGDDENIKRSGWGESPFLFEGWDENPQNTEHKSPGEYQLIKTVGIVI